MEEQLIAPATQTKKGSLVDLMRKACKKIAPVWPLENFVAVNPYLGHAEKKFDATAQYLSAVGGIQMTLPVSFYKNKIEEGTITPADLALAIRKKEGQYVDAKDFLQQLKLEKSHQPEESSISTVVDIVAKHTHKDWDRFMTSRISSWAASYFDIKQAAWSTADQNADLFRAWKTEAQFDLTPEIAGLKGFRNAIKAMPNVPLLATRKALKTLGLSEAELPHYLYRLLLRVGGWAAFVARLDWDSELQGGKDGKLIEFLAVLVCWEAALLESLNDTKLNKSWLDAKVNLAALNNEAAINQQLTQKLILQEAFDISMQRQLLEKFQTNKQESVQESNKTKAQAIFCIDVRSEVFRRNLELADQEIETIGFAGFFAFPINYIPIAHNSGEAQCPVLINTGPTILEEVKHNNRSVQQRRILKHQVGQLWKSFRSGAVTCFSFVSPMGLSYLPKLFTDSFGLTRPVPNPDQVGMTRKTSQNKTISLEVGKHNNETVGIPIEQRVQMAKNALTAMSLTDNFAPFVLIVGHGSTTVNNPHATGLDCGACGGHTGESNAKVAAAVLNDQAVRQHLKDEQFFIPDNTFFLACLHDTTTDEISIYNEGDVPEERKQELQEIKKSLNQAGKSSRIERAARMSTSGHADAAILARSKDWSQVRPEWGLAGCSAFVVAPRSRTKNLDFGGQSFLHSYDWKKDEGFGILELIMTAPMVVTSWINLQYYASTVDNKTFGSGNKTLHNVTAGVGVLEGFSGDLRVGLPLQSVHDGERFQHEPVKLNVIIEAPIDAMNAILEKHEMVKNLCDNNWIHLLAMDEHGKVSQRYEGDFVWKQI